MIENIIQIFTSICLGIMIFFSFVVAPTVFKVLDENNARNFIRKIFPFYYLVNLFILLIPIILTLYFNFINTKFYLLLLVAILFAISQFILMPLINHSRDKKKDTKFKYLHGLSVLINFLQIIILIFILL